MWLLCKLLTDSQGSGKKIKGEVYKIDLEMLEYLGKVTLANAMSVN